MYWSPPEIALEKAKKEVFDIAIQRYGPIDGIEPLKKKLKEKIENENKLTNKVSQSDIKFNHKGYNGNCWREPSIY